MSMSNMDMSLQFQQDLLDWERREMDARCEEIPVGLGESDESIFIDSDY